MKGRKPRRLTAEEDTLWKHVTRTITPFADKPTTSDVFEEKGARPAKPKKARPQIEKFDVGSKATVALPGHDLAPGLSERIENAPLRMDKRAFQKMKKGKSKPEARLDLHGMTVADAQSALTSFLMSSQAKGMRLVLVITGKGRIVDDGNPIPTRTGVLRHQLPLWASRPPLSSVILQVTEAHQRHGGSGAFYIYLRRR